MKIRVVSSKDEITTLSDDEQIIHLAFRPSNNDILSLTTQCPHMKALHIPPSYQKNISKSTKMILEMRGIILLNGHLWGHRKDINEYCEVSNGIQKRIKQYRDKGLMSDEIEMKISKETGIDEEIIRLFL